MTNFSRNIIRRFDGFTHTVDDLTYRVRVNEEEFTIGCTDNPDLEEVEWILVFLCRRHLEYETVLEILKAYGFNNAPDWLDRRMS